jgi:hypothetical protein
MEMARDAPLIMVSVMACVPRCQFACGCRS